MYLIEQHTYTIYIYIYISLCKCNSLHAACHGGEITWDIYTFICIYACATLTLSLKAAREAHLRPGWCVRRDVRTDLEMSLPGTYGAGGYAQRSSVGPMPALWSPYHHAGKAQYGLGGFPGSRERWDAALSNSGNGANRGLDPLLQLRVLSQE